MTELSGLPGLPEGLTSRPLTMTDARAVYEVMAAQEIADTGEAAIELADIVADWQRPGFLVEDSTVGVFEAERLVAYAEVSYGDRGDAAVDPAYRGRGLGTGLAGWMQARAREKGATLVGMPVPQGSPGDLLLGSLGYHVRWTSWMLELPEGAVVPERELPRGYAVRAAEESELEACWTVQEDAFLEWSVRERDSFEEWAAGTVLRPGFESWHLRVVVDPAVEVVAMALLQVSDGSGFIARLATRSDQRRRGLAQALLVDVFAAARGHGAHKAGLSTDSRTGCAGAVRRSAWWSPRSG